MSSPASQRATLEQVSAIRRDLGELLRAWRERAGLSPSELGRRIDYSRSHLSTVERGGPAAREVFEAVDPVVGAGGELLAARDRAAAQVTAIRQQADRQRQAARQRRAAQAVRMPRAAQAGWSTAQAATCPYCQQVSSMTLTALPPAENRRKCDAGRP